MNADSFFPVTIRDVENHPEALGDHASAFVAKQVLQTQIEVSDLSD
jgi:hypothetical protein